nr:angiopoietin-1-like [Drosophila kikkawai]
METKEDNSVKHILKQLDRSQQIIADHALTISNLKAQIAKLESEAFENGKHLKEMKKHIAKLESKTKNQTPQSSEVVRSTDLSTGWTVIQCRQSGRYENLADSYKNALCGFGEIDGDYWIGFEKLSSIMASHSHVLGIQLTYSDGSKTYSQYDDFKLGRGGDRFRIESLGYYMGNDRDFLRYYKDLPLEVSLTWAWWNVPSNMR